MKGLCIEVYVPSQECERSCICVQRVSIIPLSKMLIFEIGIVPTVWYFLLFILSSQYYDYILINDA
jgi:hypothetical protein